jgi:hypothetical protein
MADAKLANDLSNASDPQCLEALAAAYAESGKFPEATNCQKRSLEINSKASKSEAEDARERLKLYSRGLPFRFAVSK